MRRLATYGDDVTLRTEIRSVDTTTDWDDATETTVTTTVNAFVRPTATSQRDRSEEGDALDADATVYVYDDDLPDDFHLFDYGGTHRHVSGRTAPDTHTGDGDTYVTHEGVEYIAARVTTRSNGILEIEAVRT
jgi:hypothetical protein